MNIFEGIMHLENNVTQILYNLLEYKIFRKEFLNFLDIQEDIDYSNFDIQHQLEYEEKKYGNIDLYIEGKEQVYLIEIKTNYTTEISTHQENRDYEKYLKDKKQSGEVLYLIPKYYKHSQHFEEAKNHNKNVNILRWDKFIKKLKKEELHKINLFLEHFIDFLTNYWGIDKVVEFTNKEYNLIKGEKTMMTDISVPEMLEKLYKMIDEVVESVKTSEFFDRLNYMYEIKNENFKKYDISLYFGMYIPLWEEGEPLVLCIYPDDNEMLDKLLENQSLQLTDFTDEDKDKFLYCSFDISKKVEIDEFKKDLEDKIATISQVLSSIKCAKS